MLSLMLSFTASLLGCLALTPLVRALTRRGGLVDLPDGRRKLHTRPIPLAGGLAVLTSVVGVLALLLVLDVIQCPPPDQIRDLVGLFLGSVVICVVGLADDFGRLRGRHKLLGQLVAVSLVIGCGVQVDSVTLFGRHLELGLLSVPFTGFMLLGAINSLNLLDGMDGLLSSVGLIICLAMGVMAFVHGQLWHASVAFALAGALLGFLFFNFPPASVFLGDSGSMLIGLIVGVLAIQSSLKGPATVALAAPTAMLILPIFDTLAAILRRKLTGQSLYTTDRDHLHHCLLRRGLTGRAALFLIATFCTLAVAGGLGSVAFNNELIALLTAVGLVATLIATRLFGYAELALVKKRLAMLFGSFVPSNAPGDVKQTAVHLHGHVDWQQLWTLILGSVDHLNLCRVRLDVNAPAISERYHARWDRKQAESEEQAIWQAQIPLMVGGRVVAHIDFAGSQDDSPVWEKISRMAHLLQDFERTIFHLVDGAGDGPHRGPRRLRHGKLQTNGRARS